MFSIFTDIYDSYRLLKELRKENPSQDNLDIITFGDLETADRILNRERLPDGTTRFKF